MIYSLINRLSMNLSKVRNSDLILKVLFGIIIISSISLSSLAQVYQGNPQAVPGFPNQFPVGYPVNQNPVRQPPVDITPQNGAREVELTDADLEAMTHEDSVATAMDEIESEDLALQSLRRKIFGHKLFNLNTYDPNAVVNIPTPNNYVLGAGDQLIIDFYGSAELHHEVIVNPDGFINVPRSGLIKVSGMTIEDAKYNIKEHLKKTFSGQANRNLNVSLGNVRSIKVNITGEAITPGTYTMSSLSTVSSALYRSGGPNEIGSFREIKVIRNNKVAAVLDLYDILIKGYSDKDILLRDQDVILIPTYINRIIVAGKTKRVGYFELKNGEVLNDALGYAGGFAPDAYSHRLKIYRNNNREKEIYDILNADFKTFKITRGDSIVVDEVLERFTNMVTVEGAVYRPGEYSLSSAKTLKALIESSDGLMTDALIGRLSIVRTNDDLTISNISVNYSDILSGKVEDIALAREDLVIVPSMLDLNEEAYVRIRGAINNEEAEEGVEIVYVKNFSLQDLVVRVGGFTEAASLSNIEIVRRKKNIAIGNENAITSDIIIVPFNADFQISSKSSETMLEPFDEVFVRTSPNYQEQTYVEIQGEIAFPSTYGIQRKEERISDLVRRAGGLTLQAYIPGATIIRTVQLSQVELEQKRKTLRDLSLGEEQVIEVDEIEETREEFIDIDLKQILRKPGNVGDLILQDGDVIKIPKLLETIRVQGEVLYPTTVKYLSGAGFKNYISGAGGFTKKSLRRKSYVLYPNGSVDRTKKFLVFNIYPKIEPGSEIIIPQRIENDANKLTTIANILGTLSGTLTAIFSIYGILTLGN
ncbi:MAG: protein involved in polysaccharide export with SLBB domain [Algoriphagus sp.]